jgi:hypothetical protein
MVLFSNSYIGTTAKSGNQTNRKISSVPCPAIEDKGALIRSGERVLKKEGLALVALESRWYNCFMAIYHCKRQIIKRSAEKSTVASAAYRSGEELYDEREQETKKSGLKDRVVSSWITAPDYAGSWANDRCRLWNSLEAFEKRKDAQLAIEIECALPHELSLRQQKELIAGFVDEHFTQQGRVVDVNIHAAPRGKTPNTHFHAMGPIRGIDPQTGEWRKTKDRQDSRTAFKDNRDAELEALRASWASHVNASLEKAGYQEHEARVDHRSNKDRNIDALPGIHVGYAGQGIEARGGHSWRAEHNRQIQQHNRILEQIKAKATQAANAIKRAATAKYQELAQLARGRPADTAPKPAPKLAPPPVLQPPPMRPDKLAGGPEPTPAPKKQEPAPAPIAAKPQPAKLPEMPPLAVPDAEAEKRKAAQRAAWQQHGGGGIGG